MKKVFITGANGLLGTNLIHHLLDKGYFVKGLLRDPSKYLGRKGPNLQLVTGSLFDDFTEALADVDYVVHIAAVTNHNLLDVEDYLKVNKDATIHLFHAAAACNIKRFVFVSTANTIGHGSIDKPGDENHDAGKPFSASMYAQSKMLAENHLMRHQHAMETVVVNPTFMLGAFDTKPSSGKIILMGWKKKVIFYPPGGKNFVHVEDVAEGIIRSFTRGKSGEKYILANENLSYREFFNRLNLIAKQQPVMIKIPRLILLGCGIFGELLRKFRITTNLSLVNMKILCTSNYYTNKKSIKELGLNYRPVDVAISDALDYFIKADQ